MRLSRGLIAGVVALVGGSSASLTLAASTPPAVPAVQHFSFTGGEQTYTVPANVTMVQVEAIGGGGQAGAIQPGPGGGFDLSVGLPVTAGQTLYAEVGAPGGSGSFGGGGAGGAGAGNGGAGGGASDLRACSITATSCSGAANSAASRLVVAGGGGGGGGEPTSFDYGSPCGINAGGGSAAPAYLSDFVPIKVSGGTAFAGANDNIQTGTASGDTQAQGGSSTAAGGGGTIANCSGGVPLRTYEFSVAGGNASGPDGGAGGSGTGAGGGGGGGGYFGGGGGPSGQRETGGPDVGSVSGASGGAAGSSFYSSQATGQIDYYGAAASAPSVTITPLIVVDAPTPNATYTQGQLVDASYNCLDAPCVSTTAASGAPINTSTPGTHTFTVGDQNHSNPIALTTITYHVTASPLPRVSISGVKVVHTTAKVTFKQASKTAQAVHFQCALQSTHSKLKPHFATCKSPATYRRLRAGHYKFSVRAVLGSRSSSAATRSFSVR